MIFHNKTSLWYVTTVPRLSSPVLPSSLLGGKQKQNKTLANCLNTPKINIFIGFIGGTVRLDKV